MKNSVSPCQINGDDDLREGLRRSGPHKKPEERARTVDFREGRAGAQKISDAALKVKDLRRPSRGYSIPDKKRLTDTKIDAMQ